MRFTLSRLAIAVLGALTVSLSACVSPPKGALPPTAATPPPSSFMVYVADLATNDVRVVDPASGTTVAAIPVGTAPSAIAFDGGAEEAQRHAFVANTGSSTVSVIDPVTNAVVKTIDVCKGPHALLYHHDPDGNKYIAVACGDGSVDILSAASLAVYDTVAVGGSPVALAQAPGSIVYTLAVLGSEGRLTLMHYDLGRFKVAQTLAVQANPVVVSQYYGDYYVASSDGMVERFSNNNSNDEAVPFAYAEKNTSAHAFQAGTALLDSEITVLADGQNNVVQLFDEAPNTGAIPGHAPIFGLAQTLSTGASPHGAAAAVITQGTNAGSYLFVANSNSDSISQFTSHTADLFSVPSFKSASTISLAAGTHPVALAVYYKSTQPTPTPAPTSTPTPTPAPTPTPTQAPTATPAVTAHLYIANYGGGDVAQYTAPFSTTSTPSATFADTTPVGGPVGIAANAAYVVTSHVTGSAYAYQQPVNASSTPLAVFGGSAFGLMTFDAQGNLWATSQNSSVVEYVPPFTNSTVEAKELTTGFTSSYGIAFDASGTMYVTNSDNSATIVVYQPPYTAPSNIFTVPIPNARLRGAAISGSKLYVADTYNNQIYVYALPVVNSVPTGVFSASAPVGLAFDAGGNLYVTSQGTNRIQVFNPPFDTGSAPAFTITGGVNGAFGLAAGP